jgi:hypothetical protein
MKDRSMEATDGKICLNDYKLNFKDGSWGTLNFVGFTEDSCYYAAFFRFYIGKGEVTHLHSGFSIDSKGVAKLASKDNVYGTVIEMEDESGDFTIKAEIDPESTSYKGFSIQIERHWIPGMTVWGKRP